MKTIFVMISILLLTGCAGIVNRSAEDQWTAADTVRQTVATGLAVVDWAQTKYISRSCRNGGRFSEGNEVLGSCPNQRRVDTYMGFAVILQTVIAWSLKRSWRESFQYGVVGVEAVVVFRNNSAGVEVYFK